MINNDALAPRSTFRLRFIPFAILAIVTIAGVAVAWLVRPERVAVTALFGVDSYQRALMGDRPYNEQEFEIIKKTQLAKLRSHFVLQAAIRDPGVAGLPIFQDQPDPVAWLEKQLEVEFPENGELLAIRLRGPKSSTDELVRIVDAIAKAYEDEVLYADAQTRLSTRDLKAHSLKKIQDELFEKMQRLQEMKKEAGAAASDSVDIQSRQLEIDILSEIVRETSRSLEWDDIEANAPRRIRQLQPAVPAPDN
jgi:hypothetical protein